MGNIIRLNDTAESNVWILMSNQGTDCFLELLICAADTIEKTQNQEEMISYLKGQKAINEVAPGTASFDIDDMPWKAFSLPEDKQFFLHVVELAKSHSILDKLPYDLDEGIVFPRLDRFAEMINKKNTAASKI